MRPELAVVPIAFVVLFPAMWWLTTKLLSKGGWARLAEDFATQNEPDGERFAGQSGRIQAVRYKNCLTMTVAAQGLYLRPWALFGSGHATLLIPWSQMHGVEVGKRTVQFDAGERRVRVEIPTRVYEARPAIARAR